MDAPTSILICDLMRKDFIPFSSMILKYSPSRCRPGRNGVDGLAPVVFGDRVLLRNWYESDSRAQGVRCAQARILSLPVNGTVAADIARFCLV